MKIPKTQNHYCPKCKKHTLHIVRRIGTGKKRRKFSQGERRVDRLKRGFGSFPRPKPKNRGKLVTKLDLRYKCKECGKEQTIGKGFRIKKFEFVK